MSCWRNPCRRPKEVIGFTIGDDYELATYDQSLEYFRRLEASSDLLRLVEVGRTSEGRRWWMAVISSAANLDRLDRLVEINQLVAHPDGLSDERAAELAQEGTAFVHIDGGLHASEVAGAQHTIELAHQLLRRAAEPKVAAILERVVVLLWPSLNPDGRTWWWSGTAPISAPPTKWRRWSSCTRSTSATTTTAMPTCST